MVKSMSTQKLFNIIVVIIDRDQAIIQLTKKYINFN